VKQSCVSIIIPTFNFVKILALCLKSLFNQTYRNIEIIVVDSYSTNGTVEIAKKFDIRIILTHGGLLWTRYVGHLYSRGSIEVLLDSDQILKPRAIERCVEAIEKGCDMVILGVYSYRPRSLLQWLFYINRRHVID